MKVFQSRFLAIGIVVLFVAGLASAGEKTSRKHSKRSKTPVTITVTPWGPSEADRQAAMARADASSAVQSVLKGTSYRLISMDYVEKENKALPPVPPANFRVVFYDYSNDRTIVAEGDFAGRLPVTAHEEFYKPRPSDEEFDAAVALLEKDGRFAATLRSGSLKAFKPMPPITTPEGSNKRLINIGLDPGGSQEQREILSVDIKSGEVLRYSEKAPPTAAAAPEACGPASQTGSGSGSGQHQLTVMQGGSPLWEMLVFTPNVSSGTNGSGIEVRDVKYKGKMVLKRGHVPVLDVEYVGNTCGPYRDWQDEHDSFNAPATGASNPAPGIRVLATGQVATTILESGVDSGNFKGVAIYTTDVGMGNETVMVTEMTAGWYRYIMEWRFADDGTIRPRFGFGATSSTCVCNIHNHHVYWRLDFDIVNAANNVFQTERGRKFLQPITTETRTNKRNATRRSFVIQNSTGNEAYELIPNITDGVVDTFGVNDFWALRYKTPAGSPVTDEIDDGLSCCGAPAAIQINPWVNGESLIGQDAVIWYGAHFIHSDGANLLDPDRSGLVINGSHVVGPDIRPIRW